MSVLVSGVAERFMRYVQIDTQSDPNSVSFPSTTKQFNLSKILVEELQSYGIQDAHVDANGYVMATIPANTNTPSPVICFCAHVDTAPDCSGTDVRSILHQQYTGAPIVLPDDPAQILTTNQYPYLKKFIGKSIITASGKTLLGADDKAGVTEIVSAMEYLINHPEIKHGKIRIGFTPDEEVGKGAHMFDVDKFGAEWAYTMDGSQVGELEYENFNAAGAKVIVNGKIVHPGYAKGKLVNALKIVGEILAALPTNEFSPETTEGRQGFVHPVSIEGIAEKASIHFIVRDFETTNLAKHEARLKDIASAIVAKHIGAKIEFEVHEQYRNMKEIIDQHPSIISNTMEAYQRVGLNVVKEPIRGGTDGSRLSFMGLPCPNLFTGMQAIHSTKEWVGISDMEKAVEMIVLLVQVWEEKS